MAERYDPIFDANPIGPFPRTTPLTNPLEHLTRPPAQEETMTALDNLNLFASDQNEPSQESTNSYADLPIDPALTDEIPTLDNHLDPNLDQTHQNGDDTPSSSTEIPAPKRKTTSRASMLARGGACEFCKRRKLKCTAEMPSCAACLRAGKECIYSQKKQRSRVRVLEDRLIELEKRLDGSGEAPAGSSGTAHYISPALTDETSPALLQHFGTPGLIDGNYWLPVTTPDAGFTFGTYGALDNLIKSTEPDLMTLADAAAADGSQGRSGDWPWEGMTEEALVSAIAKAVEGGKGVGEKIVAHLLQLYLTPPSVPFLHLAIQPSTLLLRLSPASSSPPHPALILALLPFLLPLSPSPTLSSPDRVSKLSHLLLPPGRLHSAMATANADPRLLDVIAANSIRARTLYSESRFLEGWAEAGSGAALCWSTGLGKLGNLGIGMVGGGRSSDDPAVSRERRLRALRPKGVVVEQPKNPKELGERIDLFWQIYSADKAAAIGWGWASAFEDAEITTPWPHDKYDDPTVLIDNRTVIDLMQPDGTATSGAGDSDAAALYKSMTLLYHATRLYDQPACTPERTAILMKIARNYMSTLQPFRSMPTGQGGGQVDPLNESWMSLHACVSMPVYRTMMLLHAKDEIDATTPKDITSSMNKSIDSARSVVERIRISFATGDGSLDGHNIFAAVVWFIVGRFFVKTKAKLLGIPSENARVEELDGMKDEVMRALRTLGKRLRFADVEAHLLENIAMGVETKVGEWERLDNVL